MARICRQASAARWLIRGYNLFDGYYRDPVKTAERWTPKAGSTAGTSDTLDEQGHIMFHGRFKDMLKVGGENVAAAEVERRSPVIRGCGWRRSSASPTSGLPRLPAAYVEREQGSQAGERELIDFVRANIASFKVPRHIRFVEEWPMSASKIQKFKLRKELMAELGLSD